MTDTPTTASAKPPTEAPIDLYRRFVASQPDDQRAEVARLPVVVVLGERVRGGQSALIEAGTRWREAARRMQPSLAEADAPVRFYRGDELVAIELGITVIDDDAPAARAGLADLFTELRGRDVSAVIVVERDALDPGSADVLVTRAERIRGKLALLVASLGDDVDARLCITAAEGGDGFTDLVRVLAATRHRLPIDVVSAPPAVSAITAALGAVLPYGLTTLPGDAFARLVGFLAGDDGFATALAAFVAALWAPARAEGAARLIDATAFVSDGTFAGAPFPELDPVRTRPAASPGWRYLVPRCLAAAVCASLPFAAIAVARALDRTPAAVVGDAGIPLASDAGRPASDAGAGVPGDVGAGVPGDAGATDGMPAGTSDGGAPPSCPTSPPAIQVKLGMQTTRAVGIDISSYDHAPMPWDALKRAGVAFVYIKASEGLDRDSLFAQHWKDAGACGLLRGAYHLVHFNDDPAAQAAVFARQLGGEIGELPPAVDVETSCVDAAVARGTTCAGLASALEVLTGQIARSSGRVPAIYTSVNAWAPLRSCGDPLADRPLWLKHYAQEYEIRMFGGWSHWTFWQRTGSAAITGEVPGHLHQIDVDVFDGTPEELRASVPGTI